jgi:parallel beta-helix repeat protein
MRAAKGRGRGTGYRAARRRRVARVEGLESRRLLAIFTVTSTADDFSTPGTLRAAILGANNTTAADEIVFDIAGATPGTVQTIALRTNLPPITQPLEIRGSSWSRPDGTPLIEVDGAGIPRLGIGFEVDAQNVAIDTLAIVNFATAGVVTTELGQLVLTSSHVGLGADGAAGPNGTGVILNTANNRLGGPGAGAGNVISGNVQDGVLIVGPGSDGNVVQGNRIASNGGAGVNLVDPDPNSGYPAGTVIQANSITANGGLGIDYSPPAGPGGGPAFPTLTGAVYDGIGLIVAGTLAATAGTSYRVEFFADPGDPSGYGEGATFLGFAGITATTTGTTPFRVELPVRALPPGVITATATAAAEGTSEFSLGRAPIEQISFTVINTHDAGRGSLRQAILNANRVPGRQRIDFRIPPGDAQDGCFVIRPFTELPPLTEAVDLDATTQPGYADRPVVELQGTLTNWDPETIIPPDGLRVLANDVRIAGLAIVDFDGAGLRVERAARAVLEGLHVGLDCTGRVASGNNEGGIVLSAATDSRVGGLAAGLRNVIAGQDFANGIELRRGATGNRLVNNVIGTDRAGVVALPNRFGILVVASPNNAIGLASAGLGNLISGNEVGVRVESSSGIRLVGNRVGTDAAGRRVVGSQAVGLELFDAEGNEIGDAGGLGGNLIAGHDVGVRIAGAGSTGNVVRNNAIGTDVTGRAGLGNAIGVHLVDAGRNTIGGGPGAGNVLSGNRVVGVRIDGAGASGNTIQGNRIGTDHAGRRAVPNGFDGVFVLAPGNRIVGNVVSGNASTGIQLFGPNARGNTVEGNLVGTDATGARPLGNRRDGIYVNGAPGNVIANNTVSANASTGIQLFGTGASGNIVANNRIGTDAAGRAVRGLGNRFGLFLNGAGANRIGGADGANRIAGNANAAIFTAIAASAPIVEGVTPGLVAGRLVAVTLTFSRDMDPRSATDRANYRLRTASGTDLAIASATYDQDRRTVTLALAAPPADPSGTRVAVNASAPRGVRSRIGLLLDGNRDGRPGSDFAALVAV